jgi:Na+/H+-dicarboxylate symporter
MGESPARASDALFSLLMPLWQLIIGVLVVVTVVVSIHRLFMRGPTRMGGATLLAGGALVGFAVVSYLIQQL